MENCLCCLANSGERRISPGQAIFDGEFWLVEHAYPTSLLGWTVVRLKRHCEALHLLSKQEFTELAQIQFAVTKALHELLDLEKEYVACFSEKEGFKHLHVHVIPKIKGTRPEDGGVNAFRFLGPAAENFLSDQKIVEFSSRIKTAFLAYFD